MSLGLVRQHRAVSVAYRKPGRHVQRNLLAQAKGEEVVEEGGTVFKKKKKVGHFKAAKQALKARGHGRRGSPGSPGFQRGAALIEVPPSHCVFPVLTCVYVCVCV